MFNSKKLTYEECGVLGGRCLLKSGYEYRVIDSTTPLDMFSDILIKLRNSFIGNDNIYPYARLGLFVLFDNNFGLFLYTDENDAPGELSYREIILNDVSEIGKYFFAYELQKYDILTQIDESTFKVIGFRDRYDENRYLDIYRCLDLFGSCKPIKTFYNKYFNDYNCYDMGEDFYLEAYNNFTTQTREFWIGRHYMREKILVTSFDLDDHDYRGIFDDNGRIIIDNQIANIMCRLSLKEEYFFIDNDYKLSMKGIKRRDI